MSEPTHTVLTPDGRRLGFAEWGDPDGAVVLSLHGTPGSRIWYPPDVVPLRAAGVRLVTYDRPGYGVSDRHAGRRVVDCVPDVEAIVDHLGIERFAVVGRSGGGAHALALAARLPGRVTHAECAVGAAPIDAVGLDWLAGMDPENVQEFGWASQGEAVLHRELTPLAASDLERMAQTPAKVFSDDWDLPDADREILARADMQRVLVATMQESLRPGVWGWVDDDLAFLAPWGFDVSEIDVPVTIHYGAKDVMVPAAHGRWLGEHVPGARVVVDEEAGHFPDLEILVERLTALAATAG